MYTIKFHRLVFEQDFRRIPKGEHSRIYKTIFSKLSRDPYVFGKPLKNFLKGYHRLRLDPYRVIYRIEKEIVRVFVLNIGLRKDEIVYYEAVKRLGLLS